MVRLLDVVEQPGPHAAIYGGRGVGKTSLAKVMVKILSNPAQAGPVVALHYTCSATDTFASVWRSVFGDLFVTLRTPGMGFAAEPTSTQIPSTEIFDLDDDIRVDTVRRGLF